MKRIRTMSGALLAAVLVAAFAVACDDGDDPTPTEPAATATTTAPEATARTTPPAPAATPTAEDLTRCLAANLSLEILPAGGAAGTHFESLAVTNTGSVSCSVTGFPGVSLVDSSGSILGEPAERSDAVPAERIMLAPGETAHAMAGLPNYQNFPPGQCEGPSSTLVLYPPDSTASLSVPFEGHACPGFSVRVFEPGANEPGRS